MSHTNSENNQGMGCIIGVVTIAIIGLIGTLTGGGNSKMRIDTNEDALSCLEGRTFYHNSIYKDMSISFNENSNSLWMESDDGMITRSGSWSLSSSDAIRVRWSNGETAFWDILDGCDIKIGSTVYH